MDIKEKYLPIGSVLMMKGAKKRVMITGYAVKSPESGDKVWDYVGCLYPEGMVTSEKALLFDHENIETVYAIGYEDDEQKQFMTLLNKATQLHDNRVSREAQVEETSTQGTEQ